MNKIIKDQIIAEYALKKKVKGFYKNITTNM